MQKKKVKTFFCHAARLQYLCAMQDNNHRPAPTPTAKGRYYGEIDFMRAILITLVILVHIVHFGDMYPGVKYGILSFMMPAFLFITGYLVNINKPLKQFAVYILQILLPYAIMSFGYMAVSLYLPVRDGIATFDSATVSRVIFVTSIGPYWFLRVMIVCGIIYYAAFHAFARLSNAARYCIFAGLLILLAELTPLLDIKSAAYYFLGAGVRIFIGDFSKAYVRSLWAVIPFTLLIIDRDFWNWGTISVLVCVVCFVSFTSKLSEYVGGKAQATIGYIGRNTLPIYIFHPIFTMAAKYLVPLFAFDPTGILHAVTTVAASLIGCICLGKLLDLTHVSYIFGKKAIMR